MTQAALETEALLAPLEPEPRPPMMMRAVYPFGLSLRGWRRIIVTGLFVLLALAFLWRVQAILPPFIVAFFLAALLDPTVRYLERHRRSRVQAVLTIYLLGLLCVVLTASLVVPAASRQIEELSGNANTYYNFVRTSSDAWMARNAKLLRFFGIRQRTLNDLVTQKSGPIQAQITEAIGTVTAIVQGIASQAIWLIIIPVATFFVLRDYTSIRARVIALFPARHHAVIDEVSRDIVDVFSAYIQGLAKICSLYGAVVFLILWLLGHKYALFLGLMAGAFYVVPLIGPWIVAVTAGLLAYGDPHRALFFAHVPSNSIAYAAIVVLCIVVTQTLFDQLLYPRVVGGSVGLHPVVSIFALLAGATMFGIVGMVLAVPVAGSIQIVLTYFFPRLAQPPPPELLHDPPPIAAP
ncbi:MAG TPA: AI-2E family transporter [Chloroflexota bacterium]|nr:AI-2E family transporter [Chloroflexota bacterium]